MSKSNKLRVKPVRRYRIARYPSHLDPDPTLFPQKVPYPASKKFLAAIASAGIATSVSCNNDDGSSGPTHPINPNAKNPFTVEVSGLPHQTSMYGTGVPNYVDADLARRVIERTFREEGYDLDANRRIEDDGIACIADGYDAEKQMGYVFAGWNNLDSDALLRWYVTRVKAETKSGDTQSAIAAMLASDRDDPNSKDLSAEVKAANALPDPARREAVLQAILKKHVSYRISLEEIKKLEARGPRTKQFIAVISQYDRRFAGRQWSQETHEERLAIRKISNPDKQAAALHELEEKVARVAIERLEQSVREYIEWARSQGGQ